MNYRLLTDPNDPLIPTILSAYRSPSVAQFISIDEINYWNYVTGTGNVWFYKIFENECLIATIHFELVDRVLYMDVVVFPEYQKRGFATEMLKDIQAGRFPIEFTKIQVSIDEANVASIKLFENAGFAYISRDEALLEYVYIKT